MVSAEQKHFVGLGNLKERLGKVKIERLFRASGGTNLDCVEEQKHFEGEGASVHKVAQEKHFKRFQLPKGGENVHKVVILSVDIAVNRNRVGNLEDIGFCFEHPRGVSD